MYKVNDLVIYSGGGVFKVIDICTPEISGIDKNKHYYVLQSIYGDGKVYTPVDTNVLMRPIITCEKAQKLIKDIPMVNPDIYDENNPKLLVNHYKALLQSHDCANTIKLIKTLYLKKRCTVSQGRKFGQVDENYLDRAEDMLYREFAIALDMPKDSIKDYIEERVNKHENIENG